jgi:hypothetical protein
VRICSLQAIRPHGTRRLTEDSYNLLLKYAPAKPASANKIAVEGHLWEQQRIEGARHSLIAPTPSSSDRLPFHHASYTYQEEYRLPKYTQPARQTPTSTWHRNSHQTPLIPSRTEHTYGTVQSDNRRSYTPSSRSAASRGGSPYPKVCAAFVLFIAAGALLYVLFGRQGPLIP